MSQKRCEIEGWLQWTIYRKPLTSYMLLQILFTRWLKLNFRIQSLEYIAFASRGVLCTGTAFFLVGLCVPLCAGQHS